VTLYLIGSLGGYTRDVMGIARDLQLPEPTVFDTSDHETGFDSTDALLDFRGHYIACPVAPGLRWKIAHEMLATKISPSPPLIHPSSSLDKATILGEGTTINRLVAIGGDVTIGSHCQVNRSSSIGHHSIVEDFVTIGPGVTIASEARLETGCFIGAGAIILPEMKIGRNAVVGAGAVVTRPVPEFAVVLGSPARVYQQTDSGYEGFTVPHA
jgi:sugar O-acyltransferase (sialic acid O-acetyltransferase NeuD family)